MADQYPVPFTRILIIADIEGSSGCGSYLASAFLTDEWARACLAMSLDVDAVVRALFAAGAEQVTVKDFHRTGYNLLPELIDPRAVLVSGYRRGPVPGLGDPGSAEALMMTGMHAASGTDGFLPHTFSSRIASLRVNGVLIPEAALFSASLAPYGIRPVFFSGCPEACRQASAAIPHIQTFAIDKSVPVHRFDAAGWREGLAAAAVRSLSNRSAGPCRMEGPFDAAVRMRKGIEAAHRIGSRWGISADRDTLRFHAPDFDRLYMTLIRICYLTPAVEKILPVGLFLFNLRGLLGRMWVRRRLKAEGRWPVG